MFQSEGFSKYEEARWIRKIIIRAMFHVTPADVALLQRR